VDRVERIRSAHVRLLLSIALLVLIAGLAPSAAAAAPEAFRNASIADVALKYVDTWGGEACRDARRSGLTGSTSGYPVVPGRDPATGRVLAGHEGDGQCRAFVNCVLKLASGGSVWLGGGGGDYFKRFSDVGAKAITTLDDLRTGDIVQEGNGVHTYIVVDRVKGEVFDVVDSNGDLKETVLHRHRRIVLGDTRRAYRLGTVDSVDANLLRVDAGGGSFQAGTWRATRFSDDAGPTPASLYAAFGSPSACSASTWVANWHSIGLRVRFDSLSAPPPGVDVCSGSTWPSISLMYFTDERWHTDRGLRVGDSLVRLRARYPHARRASGRWWLQRRFNPCCDSYSDSLSAVVRSRRVVTLVFNVQGQGE
jgi:hypothetical protein